MKDLPLPPLNPLLAAKIQPRLMKDTYKKVHIYLFDFDLMLGKGSFSKVYKGINLNTNQQVAVKVVEMNSITTTKLKQLLLQQIDILMKIKNQNLIKCFQVLSSAKNTYIVMELCAYDFGAICDYIQKQSEIEKSILIEKQTSFINTPVIHQYQNSKFPKNQLQDLNKRKSNQKRPQIQDSQSFTKSINSISSTKSVQIDQTSEQYDIQNIDCFRSVQSLKQEKFYPFIKQIFQGLEYLQNLNIVHRDLKLSNIFVTASQVCKIGDFGFATIIPINQIEIKDTCCIGSPLYMSPQSYIENVYSLKSDIWSFGILLFQMIYGNPPHWNCPTHDILKSEIRKPINLRNFQKLCRISDQLKQVLQGCLQVDVRKRFSVNQLKQTKLFKTLFYQPLESKVIVNSRQKNQIDESSVEIFETSHMRNDSNKLEDRDFQYDNFSTIQKVKEGSIDALGYNINRLRKTQQQNVTRKYEKNQTFNPMSNGSNPFLERMENISFTDRANQNEIKHQKGTNAQAKINNQTEKTEEQIQMKLISTDLTGNIFKDINLMYDKKRGSCQFNSKSSEKKQFTYKNSEQMQNFLNSIKQNLTISSPKKSPNHINEESPITFNDLSNLYNPNKYVSEQKKKDKRQSPKFSSTFNGTFFNFAQYQKMQVPNQSRKSADLKNYSTIQNLNKKLVNPSISYSPRHNFSYMQEKLNFNMNSDNKQNLKEQNLASKNYSTGAFSPSNKHYSMMKQSDKYDYKKKILDKCISSPKFDIYHGNDIKNHQEEQEKNIKYMTTSTFFASPNQIRSPIIKNQSAQNIIKQYNLKQQAQIKNIPSRKTDYFTPKNFEGTNNFFHQFSTKNKEQSQIQKKTYWKGNNTKNFIVGQLEKQLNVNKNLISNTSTSHHVNQIPENSNLLTVNKKQIENSENSSCKRQRLASKEIKEGDQVGFPAQCFKLLNGQIIIQDACELVNLSRLLHKLSFMTENNGSSILLQQYSIQILRNLQQKCDSFQIKYNYESSTNDLNQIRETFKSNQIYLSSLMAINQKECYAIKRENPSVYKPNSSICNKTIQLKEIIDSYIKKYVQRKQALIKLFECNILFQNLTNKVKQAKQSSLQAKGETSIIKKRSSINCEKGFLNFSRLEKVIEDMQIQFKLKKQSDKNKLSSPTKSQIPHGLNNKILLKTALFYIQAVQRCVSEHSFMRLIEFAVSIMTLPKQKIEWDFLKQNKIGEISKKKSVIEILLEGFSSEIKNNSKSSNYNQSDPVGFGRNYSVLITPSFR